MLRFIMPVFFGILFLGWILYKLFITKDLMQNKGSLFSGLVFVVVWIFIYWLIIKQ